MELEDAIKTINDIEQDTDVNSLTFSGINVWPLIRNSVWQQLSHDSLNNTLSEKKESLSQKIKRKILFYLRVLTTCPNKYPRADAVFLVSTNERRVVINGKSYSQFADSMRDEVSEMGISSITLDLARKKRNNIYGNPIFLCRELGPDFMKRMFYKILGRKEKNTISGWNDFNNFLKNNYPFIKLNSDNILKDCRGMLRYSLIFENIFQKVRPKVCFLVCFYHPAGMGYALACRKLKIKCVDIQHGRIDQYHGMYAKWTNVPKDGYEIMPSTFWNWDDMSSKQIQEWNNSDSSVHKSVEGGNIWLSRFIRNKYPLEKSERQKLDILIDNQKNNILVALQPEQEPMPMFLLEAIKKSPPNFKWLIRLHPGMLNREEELEQLIKQTGNSNYEIDNSTKIPLFYLLQKVDFIITLWSSVALEALAFGAHPLVIHPNGEKIYQNFINQGLMGYCSSSQELLNCIANKPVKTNINSPAETDELSIRQNIINLFKNPRTIWGP